ncbi:TetR/AcrR family transcriptional regulator [Fusibacter paucivorans]|uniref:TetR/AcrR family transcriptional regulator n=1 Tax=Fusibacter paucivorans TaxID=76009 RepID=A0ABS5PS28_9FIRM|nr:TetR/AcrR family transcriptional regulator [Fusibacter paucivorans]MBS7527969.1 TetR/AcrR family transcriptional regulator [Fusibacter paucivorans]
MAQVLKEEIRQRIYDAALVAFYEKDFLSATMKEIALKAGIPVGLVYSYYKNKAALFDEIVDTVLIDITGILREEERETGKPSDNFEKVGEGALLKLFDDHKRIVILMDKSKGTKHEHARDELVEIIEQHIETSFSKRCQQDYESAFIHILASNFTESILEIARHYKSKEWARHMLSLVNKAYFEGVNAL